jgi:hypothetical protein
MVINKNYTEMHGQRNIKYFYWSLPSPSRKMPRKTNRSNATSGRLSYTCQARYLKFFKQNFINVSPQVAKLPDSCGQTRSIIWLKIPLTCYNSEKTVHKHSLICIKIYISNRSWRVINWNRLTQIRICCWLQPQRFTLDVGNKVEQHKLNRRDI